MKRAQNYMNGFKNVKQQKTLRHGILGNYIKLNVTQLIIKQELFINTT